MTTRSVRFAVNPVLRRELLERWRTRRAGLTLTVYLVVLGLFQYLLYRIGVAVLGSSFGFGAMDAASAGPLLGRFLLEGLLFFMLVLVLFVTPGYAAGKLAGEWERRTLPLLQVTLLRPWQIVVGKLGASVAWLVLLVAAALPLGAASFFLGGVAVGDLVRAIGYIVVIGVAVAGIALGVSSVSRRTAGSVVITYGIVLALMGGTLFVAGVEAIGMARGSGDFRTPRAMYLNPFFGLADAAGANPIGGMIELPSPLGVLASALPRGDGGVGGPDGMFREEVLIAPGPRFGPVMPEPLAGNAGEREPVWLQVLAFYVVAGLAGVLLASLRVRTAPPRPGRRRQPAPQPAQGQPAQGQPAQGQPAQGPTGWEPGT